MAPETLLHYRILRPLGSGGMGDVYLAEDTKLDRRVALKVLPRGKTEDPERRQRFEREAKAVAALNHPNIVTIYSVEQADDVTFLTMELVDGQALSAITPKGGMPLAQLMKISIPLADAVAAAHDRGITHRDLKPGNVMVTAEGRVKVLDFGLAKLNETTTSGDATMTALRPDPLTGEGRIVGTVSYMSPEQAEGKPLDHRTDIFSLGVMLYELATGERPFTGDSQASVVSSILRDLPRPINEVNQALPRDLARIVKRALVKDPDHRYQTAKDLRNDLETLKEDLDSGTLDAPAAGRRTPAAKKSRAGLLAAGVIGVFAIGGLVWYAGMGESGPSAPAGQPFDQARLSRLTSTGKVTWAALSADGRYVVHVVNDAARQSLWLRQIATTSNVQIVPPDNVRYDGVSFSPDGNFVYYVVYPQEGSFSTVYQVPVLGGAPRKIVDDVDTPLTFSPDGREMAFVRGYQRLGETAIVVTAIDGSNERKLAVRKNPLGFTLNNVAWSPDGSSIAAIHRADERGRARIVAVDVKTGTETAVGDKLWTVVESVGWMPDGRGLVVAAQEDAPGTSGQIWHVRYPGGEARRITNDLNTYAQVSLGADGRSLVAVQREGLAHLWVAPVDDMASAKQITSGTGRLDGSQGLSWTADGRIVYDSNASGNSDIWIVDASGENPRQLTVDPATDYGPNVTPDGRAIYFDSVRSGGSIWIMDLDGGNQRPLITAPGAGWPIVTADMQWVYYTSFASAHREVWRQPFASGPGERLTAPWEALGINQEGVFFHPTMFLFGLSPDGTRGLGYYADPERRGWRVALVPMAGGAPERLEIPVPAAVFTPDGRDLVHAEIRDGVPVLVRRVLDGGATTVLATFLHDDAFAFALSRDGRQIAFSRGTTTSDVVLIAQGQ